jgi:hypothetical protein
MGHVAAPVFARHVAVELLIDDLQFLGGERAGIFVRRAELRVVEQLFAPDVRADQREIAPLHADVASQFFLQRPQRALARSGRPFGIDDHRPLLPRQQLIALDARRAQQQRLDRPADGIAAANVARHVGRHRGDEFACTPRVALGREQRRHHPREGAVHDSLLRIVFQARAALAVGDVARAPAAVDRNRRHAAARCDACE